MLRRLLDGKPHAVYLLGDRVGHVIEKRGGYHAFNRRGLLLGSYQTERDACAAIVSAAGSARFTAAARSRAE
jgi:hypothetical protein